MIRRKKWAFLWILIPIIAVGIFSLLSINYLIDPNLYRNIIQKSLSLNLGREVTIGNAKISLWGGVGIALEDFRVNDRSPAFDILQAKKLILTVKIIPLFKREIKWKRVILYQPILRVVRDNEGRFNIFDGPLTREGLKASQQKLIQILTTLLGGSLYLREGKVTFSDESLGDQPLVTEIRSFNLELSKVSYHKAFPFGMSGKIGHSQKEGQFSITGRIQDIQEGMDLSQGKVEAEVKIKGIETFHFWPYLKTLLPVKLISGTLDLNAHYYGNFSGPFKTFAKINLRDVVYDHPQVFAYLLKPKWLNIDLDADYDKQEVRVSRFSLELPELWVKAKGKIYGIGTKEMGMDAEAQSGPFDLSDAKQYIPYRIITRDVSDPLFRSEGSGPVQIVSVRLSGKIPEIDHCDQLQNAHVLSIQVKMDKAQLRLPWNLPRLEDLRGNLLFKEGHLNLKEVEAKILHSRIDRANGTFYRLLQIPTLQVRCEGRMDLTDLPSIAKIEGLAEDLSAFLSPITSVLGRAEYRLSVKGELKSPLRFQHQGVYFLSKVRFVHSQIPFPILIGEAKVDLTNEAIQWSGAKVEFDNSSLLMNGSWKHSEKSGPVEIVAKGKVDFKNLFSLSQSQFFPNDFRLKRKGIESLSGTAELSFTGRTSRTVPFFAYQGELVPKGVHLLPKGASSPLIFRDGVLLFSNIGVTFSKMKVQSRNSFLTLDGTIKEGNLNLSSRGTIDLRQLHALLQTSLFPYQIRTEMAGIQNLNGEADIRVKWLGKADEWPSSLKEGEIKLKEVSFQYQKIPVPLSHIEGSLLISPEKFQLKDAKGNLGDSPLMVSGTFSRSPSLRSSSAESSASASFQIFSPQLNLDPLFLKREEITRLTSFEKIRHWLLNWNFDATVEVDQGSYRGLLFQDLKVGMKTVEGKLILHPFQFKGAGGDLWGEGWIQPTEKGIRFEINPRLSNMEAKAFLRVLLGKGREEKIEVSGRIHVDKVELRGEGEDFQKVKESLNGNLRFESENGVIERFNILSKIFSILNVSQLFRGRFPDLKTRGLPYHHIMANIHIKDGVASTENFLVDSDAMRITLLGKVDLGKNQIDAKIGIHPLVTLDTVLSNVPIAGYILTGKDKAFLSYVYEVRGDLDDPKIEAIPIKSVGEGLLGIIKRSLETPLRPFQKAPSTK